MAGLPDPISLPHIRLHLGVSYRRCPAVPLGNWTGGRSQELSNDTQLTWQRENVGGRTTVPGNPGYFPYCNYFPPSCTTLDVPVWGSLWGPTVRGRAAPCSSQPSAPDLRWEARHVDQRLTVRHACKNNGCRWVHHPFAEQRTSELFDKPENPLERSVCEGGNGE
ncbi:hypothetical protein L209DRAFT_286518 [Thermothelomyces heterothallicus CBS 203.75]